MEIKVRKGTAADIPSALELVKELALYEKAPLEVENSVEEMLKDGFGASPVFGLFVAEVNGKTEGIAIWYYKYSTWKGKCIFLEDIVVTESMRGKGIGAKLFEAVVALAREEKVRRMEWQVLDWNEPAIRFYKKYNAVLDPEWVNGKLTFDQLQQTSYSLI